MNRPFSSGMALFNAYAAFPTTHNPLYSSSAIYSDDPIDESMYAQMPGGSYAELGASGYLDVAPVGGVFVFLSCECAFTT